jgi:hypothetical protein
MKPLIALLVLGSIATSALAAGTDIHEFANAQTGHTVISQQPTQISGYQGAFTRAGGYFSRGSAGFGHW